MHLLPFGRGDDATVQVSPILPSGEAVPFDDALRGSTLSRHPGCLLALLMRMSLGEIVTRSTGYEMELIPVGIVVTDLNNR